MEPLTEKAKKLIFDFEGIDQPSDWPGGDSGITIGLGYDLGYESAGDFETDWQVLLGAGDFTTLSQVVGLKGTDAQAKAPGEARPINAAAHAAAIAPRNHPPGIRQSVSRGVRLSSEQPPPDAGVSGGAALSTAPTPRG